MVDTHVIFLTTSLSRSSGGPFFSVSGLARAVGKESRASVSVVGAYADEALWPEDQLQWSGTPVAAMPYKGLRSVIPMRDALSATLFADTPRADGALVHLHGIWNAASLSLALLNKPLECPLIISPRGMLEPWALSQRRIKKMLAMRLWQRGLLAQATLLHATSQMEYEGFRRLGLRNPVAIVPNGIELPHDVVGTVDDCLNKRRSQGDQQRKCIFLSRLHPKKGLPLLLSAWHRLRPRGWTLHIAGASEGGHDREIRDMIHRMGLEGVFLVGDLRGPEKWRFLGTADLFVLPSYSENFGIAVAEAMAMGVPVITTQGTPWQVLRDQQMGWWIPADEQSLAEAMHEATTEQPSGLFSRGQRARRYVLDTFGWASVGRRMSACYDWALARGPLPPDIVLV